MNNRKADCEANADRQIDRETDCVKDEYAKTEVLKIKNDTELPPFEAQALVVRNGGIVAFPTETVYGLAADPDRADAIEAVFRMKERDRGKPLTIHISDSSVVEDYADFTKLSEGDVQVFRKLTDRFWPGPLALILPKKNTVSDILTGGLPTIAFRFPSHPVSIAFIDACGGAVAGTSANVSGNFSCTTGRAVYEELGGRIDCILEADYGILGIESTIISIGGGVNILRQGAIGMPMIESVLRNEEIRFSKRKFHSSSVRTSRSKVLFYSPEEVTKVFEQLVTDERVAAVFFSNSVYYNISPILSDKNIKSRVRIMTKESLIAKFYKVLRALDSEEIQKIYLPQMDGAGVESSICGLFGR